MVYLLHFERPLAHAQHYIGWAKDKRTMNARIKHHAGGTSRARIMEVIHAQGIGFQVVKTWVEGDRNFERRLKNQKHAWRHCLICRAAKGWKVERRSGGIRHNPGDHN